MNSLSFRLLSILLFVLTASSSRAAQLPGCYDFTRTKALSSNNSEVLTLLQKPDREFHRALLTGKVVKQLADRTDHSHFIIDLNADGFGDVEVIYQNAFGDIPLISPGMSIQVCGDFKSQRMDGVGGFVHWTHCNPGTREPNHPQGYVAINNVVYGTQAPMGEPACVSTRP